MSHTFEAVWWSVKLPKGCSGKPDAECATLQANPALGALQISSARKETGLITDEDLHDFAKERMVSGIELREVTFGLFSGLSAQHFDDKIFCQEWWLRSEQLMVYVTYTVARGAKDMEVDQTRSILDSLAPILS